MGDGGARQGRDLRQLTGGEPLSGFEGEQDALAMFIPQRIEEFGYLLPGIRDGPGVVTMHNTCRRY